MKKIKAIICDIDGTIRKKGEIDISAETKDVLTRLHQHGVLLGIASGRSIERELIYCAEKWGLDFQFDFLIGENGSEYYDHLNRKYVELYTLKKEWVKEIVELMFQFGVEPMMYSHGKKLVLHPDTMTTSIHQSPAFKIVEDISEFWETERKKIMYRLPEEKSAEIYHYVATHPNQYYKGVVTNVGMLEFVEKHVNKAEPIKMFCEAHSFDIGEFMAFGDTSNDNEMLEACGYGICMKNGTDDTKAIADEITDLVDEENGFADYVERHILEPRGW